MTVSFDAPRCSPGFNLDMDDHGSTVLPEESPTIIITGSTDDCTADLTSSDGRGVSLAATTDGYQLTYTSPGVAPHHLCCVAPSRAERMSWTLNIPFKCTSAYL